MTPEEAEALDAAFAGSFPKAIDFSQKQYELEPAAYLGAAAVNGYRLAGFRLERAVFTTSPLAPDAQNKSEETA